MHEDNQKLEDVHPDETFKTNNGQEIKNLKQLMHVLSEISQSSFDHHVNDDSNDFANWIRHSVKDPELADMVQASKDFEKTKEIINDRIQVLEKKIEVRKIKDSLEDLRSDAMGIDKIPDDLSDPKDLPEIEEAVEEAPKVEEPSDLAHAINTSVHPFEHVKKSIHLMIRDMLIGVLVGLVIGYIIGAYAIG